MAIFLFEKAGRSAPGSVDWIAELGRVLHRTFADLHRDRARRRLLATLAQYEEAAPHLVQDIGVRRSETGAFVFLPGVSTGPDSLLPRSSDEPPPPVWEPRQEAQTPPKARP